MKLLLLLLLIFGSLCYVLAQDNQLQNGNIGTLGGQNAGAQRNGINPQYNPGFGGGLNPGAQRNGINQQYNPGFGGGQNAGPQRNGINPQYNPGFGGGLNPGAQRNGINPQYNPGYSGGLNAGAQRNGINPQYNPGYNGGLPPGNGRNLGLNGGRNEMVSPGYSGGVTPGNVGQGSQFGGGRPLMPGNAGNSQFPVGGNGIGNPGFGRGGLTPGNGGQNFQLGGGRGEIPSNTGNFQFPGSRNGMNNENIRRTGSPQLGGGMDQMRGNSGNLQFPGSGSGINNANFRNELTPGSGGQGLQFSGRRDGIPGNTGGFQSLGGGNGINSGNGGQGLQFGGGRSAIPGNTGSLQPPGGGTAMNNPMFGNGINNPGLRNGINSGMGGEYAQLGRGRTGIPENTRDFQSLRDGNGINNPNFGGSRLIPRKGGDAFQFSGGRGGLPGNAGTFPTGGYAMNSPNFENNLLTQRSETEGIKRDEIMGRMPGNAGKLPSLQSGNRIPSPELGNVREDPQLGRGMTGNEGFQSLTEGNGVKSPNFGISEPAPQSIGEGVQFSGGKKNTEFPRCKNEDFAKLKEMNEQENGINKLKNVGCGGKDSSGFKDEVSSTVKKMSGEKKDEVQSLKGDDDSSDQCSNTNNDYDYYDDDEYTTDSGDEDSTKELRKEGGEYKTLVLDDEKRKSGFVSKSMLSNKRQDGGDGATNVNDNGEALKKRMFRPSDEEGKIPPEIQDTDLNSESFSTSDFNKIREQRGKSSERVMNIKKSSDDLSEMKDLRTFSEDGSGMDDSFKTISATPRIPDGKTESFATDSKNFNFGRRPSLSQADKDGSITSLGRGNSKPIDENETLKRFSGAFDNDNSEITNRGKVIGNKGRLSAQRLRELSNRKEDGASTEGLGLPKDKDMSFSRVYGDERPDIGALNRPRMNLQRQLNAGDERMNWFNYGVGNSDGIGSQEYPAGFGDDSISFGGSSNGGMASERLKMFNDNNKGLYQQGIYKNIEYPGMASNPSSWFSGFSGGDLGSLNGRGENMLQENTRSYGQGEMANTALSGISNGYGGWYRAYSQLPNTRDKAEFGQNFGTLAGNTSPFGLSGKGNTESKETFRLNNREIQSGGGWSGAASVEQGGIQTPFSRERDISGRGEERDSLSVKRQGIDLARGGRGKLKELRPSFSRIQDNGRKLNGKLQGSLDNQEAFLGNVDESRGELDEKLRGSMDNKRAFLDDASGRVAERSMQTASNGKMVAGRVAEAKDGVMDGMQGAGNMGRSTLDNSSGGASEKLLSEADMQRSNVGGKIEGARRAGMDVTEEHGSDLDMTEGTESSKQFIGTANGAGSSVNSNAEGLSQL